MGYFSEKTERAVGVWSKDEIRSTAYQRKRLKETGFCVLIT
jgi:hypothetical protein